MQSTEVVEMEDLIDFIGWAKDVNLRDFSIKQPQELLELKTLTLREGGADFINFIPSSIKALKNLQELIIELPSLQILPLSIAELPNLKILSIHFFNDTMEIPLQYKKLKKLEVLKLSGYSLSTLPLVVTTFTNLKALDIKETAIDVLPKNLQEMTHLETLYCNLSEIPEFVCHLPNLKNFSYGKHWLKELPPSIDLLLAKGFIDINGAEEYITLQTLKDRSLLHNGFSIIYSYPTYNQKNNYMEVTHHRFNEEPTIEQIPNKEFMECIEKRNNYIKDVVDRFTKTNTGTKDELSDEEQEFEEYLLEKQAKRDWV